MRTIVSYQCEICGDISNDAKVARRCEAQGLPAPMPWLPIGERIPAFGENGVKWATITGVRPIGDDGRHVWSVTLDRGISLSHNQEYDSVEHASWFDPRQGYDTFRYGATAEDLRTWEEAMRRYGFAESEASERVRDHVVSARAKLAEARAPEVSR